MKKKMMIDVSECNEKNSSLHNFLNSTSTVLKEDQIKFLSDKLLINQEGFSLDG